MTNREALIAEIEALKYMITCGSDDRAWNSALNAAIAIIRKQEADHSAAALESSGNTATENDQSMGYDESGRVPPDDLMLTIPPEQQAQTNSLDPEKLWKEVLNRESKSKNRDVALSEVYEAMRKRQMIPFARGHEEE